MPEIGHWLTWKEKCALALCPPAIQGELRSFVHTRFLVYAKRYADAFQVAKADTADARDAWHWFETHFVLNSSRQGKSYKEWLFARAALQGVLDTEAVESGVSLLLRNVVRDRLSRECQPKQFVSLDATANPAGESGSVSFEELIPDSFDTTSEVEQREVESIAAGLAESVVCALSRRERIALLGRELGISLANPVVLKAAGCGKTAMTDTHRSALKTIADHVAAAYPAEARPTLAALTVAVFSVLKKRTILWARAENSLSELLNIVGG